jgi:hypothetical protein
VKQFHSSPGLSPTHLLRIAVTLVIVGPACDPGGALSTDGSEDLDEGRVTVALTGVDSRGRQTGSTTFRPSLHGWKFANPGQYGNCGGMSFSAMDYYFLDRAIPTQTSKPAPGSKLREMIEARQLDTLNDGLGLRVVDWTAQTGATLARRTKSEWPAIRRQIDDGVPVTLVLIQAAGVDKVGDNHQVVAYRYEFDPATQDLAIFVYDSNEPGSESMAVRLNLGRGDRLDASYSPSYPMRGFLQAPYDRDVNVHIHRLRSNGSVAERIDQRTWSKGWTHARPFRVGGRPFVFLFKRDTGIAHVHALTDTGAVGDMVDSANWTDGWTTVEFFEAGGYTYLLALKREGKASDGRNVHVHRMNTNGSIGALAASYDWSEGWTQARPYTVGGVGYVLLLKEGDGTVHIHRPLGDGRLGDSRATYDWSSGWTSAETYAAGGSTYLMLVKQQGLASSGYGVHVHRFNGDGTVGPRVRGYVWGDGWTHVRPFVTAEGTFLLRSRQSTGDAYVQKVNPSNGTLGSTVGIYRWSPGWSSMEIYAATKGPTLFLLKDTQRYQDDWFDIPLI